MKIINRVLLFFITTVITISCYDESQLPYPEFIEGVSLRALPKPWTSRPSFSLASPTTPFILEISSFNASSLSKVDIYVSYLTNTAVPSAMGTGDFNQFVAPIAVTSGLISGWIPEVPASGTNPVTISYSRYDQLINGKTLAGVTFTALPKTLFKTLTEGQIIGDLSFTLNDLATATGITLPSTVPDSKTVASVITQPAFLLTFEVTKKDGSKYSYINSGPGVTANPATGRVADRFFTGNDVNGTSVANVPYKIILTGNEGSPFIPGVSIRIAP